jgi:hypothetical protein
MYEHVKPTMHVLFQVTVRTVINMKVTSTITYDISQHVSMVDVDVRMGGIRRSSLCSFLLSCTSCCLATLFQHFLTRQSNLHHYHHTPADVVITRTDHRPLPSVEFASIRNVSI